MSAWLEFDYTVIRFVPCVHRGSGINVGVVLHTPTRRHIRARFIDDLSALKPFACGMDLDRLGRYFRALIAVADGSTGPLADLSPSERFHWLSAPRSDVLQPTPPHPGRTRDIDATFERIFDLEVRQGLPRDGGCEHDEELELREEFKFISPEEFYRAWLTGDEHAAMTGGTATGEPTVGTSYSAWDDYIRGENLQLEPGERIVQTWRTTEFPSVHPDSRLELVLEPNGSGGTIVTLHHTGIPAGQSERYESGWREHYFEPMRKHFSGE